MALVSRAEQMLFIGEDVLSFRLFSFEEDLRSMIRAGTH